MNIDLSNYFYKVVKAVSVFKADKQLFFIAIHNSQ